MDNKPDYRYLRGADVEIIQSDGQYIFKKIRDAKEYQPFDYYETPDKNLYMQFSQLDENNVDSIAGFIREYGFLSNLQHYEPLSIWQLEIYRIRLILKIYTAISGKEDDFTNFVIEHTYMDDIARLQKILSKRGQTYDSEYGFLDSIRSHHLIHQNKLLRRNEGKKFYIESRQALKAAMLSYMQNVLNSKTKDVRHRIQLTINNADSFDYDEYVEINTLSEAIYSMLYQDLLRGKRLLICKACGEYFILKKSERMREWCKPECRPKLHHQKYDVKIKSDPVLEELVKTRKRMDRRQYAKGKKAISFDKYEDFKEKALSKKIAYEKGQLSEQAFLNWLKKFE